MFGHNWEPGEGTLVEVRSKHLGPGDNSAVVRYYLMDIKSESGEAFRTEVREPLMTSGSFVGPTIVGEVVKLECDPKRQKARFHGDPAKEEDHIAALQAEGERLDAEERRESGEAEASH